MAQVAQQSVQTLNSLQQVVEFQKDLPYYDKNASALVKMLMMLNKRRSSAIEVNWAEDDLIARSTDVTTAVLGTGTNKVIQFRDTTILRVDDLVLNIRTGEQDVVTAVTSTNATLANFGTVSDTSFALNDSILVLSQAAKHGDTSRTVKMTTKTIKTNYLQEYKQPIKVNKELAAVDLYGMPEREYQRLKAADELLKDKNYSYWFGLPKKSATASDPQPRYSTGGIQYWIDQANGASTTTVSRIMNMNAALTQTLFEQWLRAVKRFNRSGVITLFASSVAMEKITQFLTIGLATTTSQSSVYYPQDLATGGLNIKRYNIANMTVDLVEERFFEDFGPSAGTLQGYSKFMFALDMSYITELYGAGWDNVMNTDIQPPDAEYYLDQLKALSGLEVRMAKSMGYSFNL